MPQYPAASSSVVDPVYVRSAATFLDRYATASLRSSNAGELGIRRLVLGPSSVRVRSFVHETIL